MNIRTRRAAAVRAGPAIANAARGSSLRTHANRVAGGLRGRATFLADQLSTIATLIVGMVILMGVWFPIPEARILFYLILRPTMTQPGQELGRVNKAVLKLMFGSAAWLALEREFLGLHPHYRPLIGPVLPNAGATMTACEIWLHAFSKAAIRAHPVDAREEAEEIRNLIDEFRTRELARSGIMMTMEETRTRIAGHLMQEDLNTALDEDEWNFFNGRATK